MDNEIDDFRLSVFFFSFAHKKMITNLNEYEEKNVSTDSDRNLNESGDVFVSHH